METRKVFFLSILLMSLCFIPTFSVTEEKPISLNFWPLFHYHSDPIEGAKEIEGIGPFFYWKKDPDRRQWGIRPLFYWTEEDNESLWRLEYLYPFGKYQTKEGDKKGYFAPLSLFREETFDGKKRWDFHFFPFFIGETESGKDYFGIFPIYGFLYRRYGKDEIYFYLWPLYSRSTSEGVRTTNLLWPFLSFITGEKTKGHRFWPFYGHREEIGVSRSDFFLWPIFLSQTKGMDTDDPVDDWMIFPFYVSKESRHFESKTFLWPLFTHASDRLVGYEQWDLPWPFFQTLKGEGIWGIKFFPFYGYKSQGEVLKRTFILYPLYQWEEDQVGDVHERTTRFLLLNRIRTGTDLKGIKKENSIRIWPLFDYEREETGHTTFSFFYFFPFKEEGFERNLFPLFRIFRWDKNPQGGSSTNFLWGFYKRMKREDMDSWEVAHLIKVRKEQEKKTVSFFKGLFWYKSDGRVAQLRFFYFPFHLRWLHSHPSTPPFANGREEG